MIDEGQSDPEEVEDLRPSHYWGRHVLAKILLFGSAAAAVAGTRAVGDDGGTLLMGGGTVILASFMLVGAVEAMRGRVSPLPGRDMKLLSPVAGVAWATGFLVIGIIALGTVALDVNEGERPGWMMVLATVVGGLVVIGVMIQIGSLSDQWPDRWRPPYARQQVPDGSPAGPESKQSSRGNERP